MPIGISNITVVTMDNITSIANVSSYPEFLINVNHTIFGGVFFFAMLWVLWFILFKAAQEVRDEMLVNAMYSGVVVSVVSFILRAVNITQAGIVRGMLTDVQMWIFPLITIILATIIWGSKQ